VAPPKIKSVFACSLKLEAIKGQFRFSLNVFYLLKIEALAIRQITIPVKNLRRATKSVVTIDYVGDYAD
jgi:hypothetical protein